VRPPAALRRRRAYRSKSQPQVLSHPQVHAISACLILPLQPRSGGAGHRRAGADARHLDEMIKDNDKLTSTKRAELRGAISTKPGLNRYLRVTPGGLLRIDAAAIKAEENLGKYLLRCSDPKLPAEDIALGYKQLLEAERGWRDLKQVIDLRPACHRKAERIRAHVILCWLALLLIRIAETTTGVTWAKAEPVQRLAVPGRVTRFEPAASPP